MSSENLTRTASTHGGLPARASAETWASYATPIPLLPGGADALRHIRFEGVEPPPRRVVRNWMPPMLPRPAAGSPAAARSESNGEKVMAPFAIWLLRRAGLNAACYRPVPMQRRLRACLRALRVPSIEAAQALLETRPELLSTALNSMLIGVSSFFRDKPVFDCIRASVLPELLSSRNGLRVFSAGVSQGQELYSMAMLLAEAGALEQSLLLGMDCRRDAIRSAQAGRFDNREVADLDAVLKHRYFRAENREWIVRDNLGARIEWRVGDVFRFDQGRWDVILFRNVAIYLNESDARRGWERLCARLVAGGFLVTGKAEKPPGHLPLRRVSASVYRKLEE